MSGKSDEHTGGYERGWRDGFDEGFASADGFFVDVDDETLASHGLMRLPVDAHGEQVECHDARERGSYFLCSRCGAFLADGAVTDATSSIQPSYCPNCGARITEVD